MPDTFRFRNYIGVGIIVIYQIYTWIFLLCVKFVPKFTRKTYQKADIFRYLEDPGMTSKSQEWSNGLRVGNRAFWPSHWARVGSGGPGARVVPPGWRSNLRVPQKGHQNCQVNRDFFLYQRCRIHRRRDFSVKQLFHGDLRVRPVKPWNRRWWGQGLCPFPVPLYNSSFQEP